MSNSENPSTKPVIVGVDGSPTSILALVEGARLADALGSPLLAISAWRYPAFFGDAVAGLSPESDAHQLLDVAVAEAFGEAIPANLTREARHGAPADVLISAAKDAQMVVVGNRGRGGFAGLLLGSVSSTVSEHASSPVLIIHDKDSVGRASAEPEAAPQA